MDDLTPDATRPDVTPVVAALKKSGFPLQTRVQHEVQSRAPAWTAADAEHPWRDPDGKDQFIDLLAYCRNLLLVIECRKAQERSLLFLRPDMPDATTRPVTRVTGWQAQKNTGAGRDSGTRLIDTTLALPSFRAHFCVVADKNKSDARLLEQDARLVARAAESVANRFVGFKQPGIASLDRLTGAFILPVIVTTASLFTLSYRPTEVELQTGALADLDVKRIEPIPWVRFHKTLTTSDPEQTVLVVNASALPTFLDEVAHVLSMA
jgi:hypothetical protein